MGKSIIRITEGATRELKNILNSRIKYKGFYFGIKNIIQNEYDLIPMRELKKITKDDKICKVNDIYIQICGHSLSGIIGTTIDWNKNNMSSKFVFNNPNILSK